MKKILLTSAVLSLIFLFGCANTPAASPDPEAKTELLPEETEKPEALQPIAEAEPIFETETEPLEVKETETEKEALIDEEWKVAYKEQIIYDVENFVQAWDRFDGDEYTPSFYLYDIDGADPAELVLFPGFPDCYVYTFENGAVKPVTKIGHLGMSFLPSPNPGYYLEYVADTEEQSFISVYDMQTGEAVLCASHPDYDAFLLGEIPEYTTEYMSHGATVSEKEFYEEFSRITGIEANASTIISALEDAASKYTEKIEIHTIDQLDEIFPD